MSRFDRQEMIAGWDQQKLSGSCIAIVGRGWTGTFSVWACCSMGIGTVLWIGKPQQKTQRFADWFLSDECPFESSLIELPFDPHFDAGLEWGAAQAGYFPSVCIDTSEDDSFLPALERVFGQQHGGTVLCGGTRNGGWITASCRDSHHSDTSRVSVDAPEVAMSIAALLSDATRSIICPLPSDIPAEGGILGWSSTEDKSVEKKLAVLVGGGGIGCWASALLGIDGHDLVVVDGDHVELNNLPRQGLFSADDAIEQRNKAVAVKSRLSRLAPDMRVAAVHQRVDLNFLATVRQLRPTAILSAVDNAESRLVLQQIGQEAGVPVIQSGTDVFCADCFTQVPGGALLNAQMHGALSAATQRESASERGSGACLANPSYVIPGMLAGAMLVWRFNQIADNQKLNSMPPIRWRQGNCPIESGSMPDELSTEFND